MKNKIFLAFLSLVVFAGLFSEVCAQSDEGNAENSNSVAIAMATDSNYVYPTIVSMTSILESRNPNTKVDFYVMISGNFEQSLKDKILHLQAKYSNCTVNLIDMQGKVNSLYTSRHITSAAYYRLMLPSVLQNLDKVLYVDTDTVTRCDLTELFNKDISSYYVAGVLDGVVPINGDTHTMQQRTAWSKGCNSYEEVLKIPDMNQYINSGMCLFNLKNMRNDDIENKMIKTASENKFEWHDQDTLNVVCYGKIKLLPLKYNVMSHCVFENVNNLHPATEVNNAKTNPCIIHYTAGKPWRNPFAYPQSSFWWKYAEKTDCFKDIQEKYLIKNGTYIISSSLNHNKVLDISRASCNNSVNLQLWDKNQTNAQKFIVEYVGDRCYKLTAKCSSKVVDVEGAKKTCGTPIQQYENNGTDAQKWYIMPCGNEYYNIVSKCNMLNLDVSGAKTKNGTKIHCWERNNTDAQKFKFNEV